MKHEKTGFEDRNLLLGKFSGQETGELDETQVSPDEVAGLRGAPGVPEERFAVVLIGKDDGEKHRSYTPLSPRDIFDRIDAMPMRRSEIRRNDWGLNGLDDGSILSALLGL